MTITVRQWFRLQRADLWRADLRLFQDLDRLTEHAIRHEDPDPVTQLGFTHRIVFSYQQYETWMYRASLLEKIRGQMLQAMEEIDRELARRAVLERIAPGFLS